MIKCFESFNKSNDIMNYLRIMKSIFRDVEMEFNVPITFCYKEISGHIHDGHMDYKIVNVDGQEGKFSHTSFYAPCGYFSISSYLPDDIRLRSQNHIDFSKSIYIDKCIDKLHEIGFGFSLRRYVNRKWIFLALVLDSPIKKDLSISMEEIEELLVDYRDDGAKIYSYFTHGTISGKKDTPLWRIISIVELDYFIKSIEFRGLEFYSTINDNQSIIDIVC